MINLDILNKQVEAERKKTVYTRNILILANIIVFFFTIGSVFSVFFGPVNGYGTHQTPSPSNFMSSMIIFMVTAFVSMIIYTNIKGKYTYKVKDIVFRDVFTKQFDDVTFDPKKGIAIQTLRDYRLVDTADSQSTNDYLKGSFENIPFTRSDVHTQSTSTDSDGNTTYHTVFLGQVYSFSFNKNNTSNIRVVEKGFLNSFKIFNKNAIALENTEFNDLFSVNSDDSHDVFYVFTPHFIEKYMALHRKLDGKTCMVIADGTLFLAINNKRDSFEPKVRVLDDEFKTALEQDINVIKTIIHDLDLTNTLFSEK